MNITFVISSLGAGGAENVLSALANYLVHLGHQISIITLASPGTKPFYSLNPSINLIQLDQTDNECRVSLLIRLQNIVKRILSLRKSVKDLKSDLVISFVDIMNIATLIATTGLKKPIIISERIDPHFHAIPSFYKWLRLKIYPLCFQLVVQTESAAKYFPESYRKFITIIPNPVSKPELQKDVYVDKITHLVTVGRLDSQKDHVTLIKAFSNLTNIYPYLTLTIYGEGKERKNLADLIHSLNLQKKVYLAGTTQSIQETLINSDLFIFPSLYEGFPNALCEAMVVGLPVIASNCSGNVDIISDGINGRLFSAGNDVSLTNTIIDLLNNPEECRQLSENGKKICKTFNPSQIFSLWKKIINAALKQ